MTIEVKICGLREAAGLKAAMEAGARYVGFVFHAPSSRHVAPAEAGPLAAKLPSFVKRVGLFVDAGDDEIREVLRQMPLDILQLHGNETPERVEEVTKRTGLPVMKALHVATMEDLKPLAGYEAVAERLLFDTRIGKEPTGGTGKSFDWNLLRGLVINRPWMLAGGLHADNLAEAVRVSGARAVDVSSGVENAAGAKDRDKIRRFIEVAKTL
ncbi:MAG: phosphoribosylanthranilate isomerase [Pseudomonadota bacterium]|nr:phosphoribosylanthranilate isomerase [Pseudomonadota bacterium]